MTVTTAAFCCALAGAGAAVGAATPTAGLGLTAAPPSVSVPLGADGGGEGSTWGTARELPGFPKLGGFATPESLACPSPGNCSVGGSYNANAASQAFVADEKAGSWRPAIEVPGTAALNFEGAEVTSVSCVSAGNCTAGGDYNNGVSQAFVASEANGAWHGAFTPPGTYTEESGGGSEVTSVSCKAGFCADGGFYEDDNGVQQAFVGSENHGTWQTALEVPGTGALNTGSQASVIGVSCGSPGNCTADGYYSPNENQTEPFVVSENNGKWGMAQPLPVTSVTPPSCVSAGNCAIAGSYVDSHGKTQAFVQTQKNGTWQPAQEVAAALNTGGSAAAAAVTCPSAGNCAAAGAYSTSGGTSEAFVVTEKNGTWQPAREVAAALNTSGHVAVDTISCPSAGDCAAGGSYAVAAGKEAFVVTEKNGTWQPAREVAGALNTKGDAETIAVACPSVGSCTAVGSYFGAAGFSAFTVAGSIIQPTSTAMSLSARTVTYGHEQSERISVFVKAGFSGTPSGTVTVRAASATVCVIVLRAGKGSCLLAPRKLRRGTYHLIARYPENSGFLGSATTEHTLTVS